LGDKAYVLPGQQLVKTWKIKNIGKQDIPNGVLLKYDGKPFNPIINGVSFTIPSLKVNEECDISIVLQSPLKEDGIKGKQKSFWRLVLPNGQVFGPVFRVRFFIVDDENDNNNNGDEEKKVDDNNDNNNNKKEDNKTWREEKRREKLLKLKAKLEDKVAKLDANILSKQDNNNNNNNGNDNEIESDLNEIYVNKESIIKKPQSPIVIEQSEPAPLLSNDHDAIEHQHEASKSDSWNEVDISQLNDHPNDNNNNNAEIINVDVKDVKDVNNKNENEKDAPILISNINNNGEILKSKEDEEEKYQYKDQLKMLLSMGFENVDYIRQLLNDNKGNVDAVINILFS
jgi:hypothetical protein